MQALQKTKKIVQKVKKMLQETKKNVQKVEKICKKTKKGVQKVKKMLQEVRMMVHLSLLIKDGPILEPAIRDWLQGCRLQPHAQSSKQTIHISVFDTCQGTQQIMNGISCSACTTSCYMHTKCPHRFKRTKDKQSVPGREHAV